jgi:hypothetical protein
VILAGFVLDILSGQVKLRPQHFMSINFLLFCASAFLFAWLARDAREAFHKRLAELLPRSVTTNPLGTLFSDYQHLLGTFRRKVLPFAGLNLVLNTVAAVIFVAALWAFPPDRLAEADTLLLQRGSALVVPIAFIFDFIAFCKVAGPAVSQRGRQ